MQNAAQHDDLFAVPSGLGGSSLKVADLQGKLIVLRATGNEREMTTAQGVGVARPAQVLVIGESDVWQDLLIFAKGLLAQLGRAGGKPVVGVLGQGQAQPGRNAPWLVLDATPEQHAQAKSTFLKTEAGF